MSDEIKEEVPAEEVPAEPGSGNGASGRAIGIAVVAVAAAAAAFYFVRRALSKAEPAADPTAARIQALMDEANRLLKELDAKKLG